MLYICYSSIVLAALKIPHLLLLHIKIAHLLHNLILRPRLATLLGALLRGGLLGRRGPPRVRLPQRLAHDGLHGRREEVALHGGDAAGRLRGEDVDAEDVRVGARALEGYL